MSPADKELALPSLARGRGFAVALVVGVTVLAYAHTFGGPFVLDDIFAVTENPSLRRLADWPAVLWPPASVPTGGRPLLNLSFALNFAAGGLDAWGYHAVNLAIHVATSLLVFGLVQRTLQLPRGRYTGGRNALPLALLTALIWALHPLSTSAVTYISQRAESLMALWYLATIYCFARGTTVDRPGRWHALAVVCCAAGMATKEVMVTAPLLVLLYDRTFVSDSWREVWVRHRGLHGGLAATWLLLAALMIGSGIRGRGIADEGSFTAWTYALTECEVVPRYFALSIWPHPLVFDYEIDREALATLSAGKAFLPALVILGVVAASLRALRRGAPAGFFGVVGLLVLAPTSSIVPIGFQPMAESRMYLPLLGLVAGGIAGLHVAIGRRLIFPAIGVVLALLFLTWQRNGVYATEAGLWADTVAKRPQNARAHNAYGLALSRLAGRLPDEIAQYEQALHLRPDYADAHMNLGNALLRIPSRRHEAVAHYESAVRANPRSAQAHSNLGNVLSLFPDRRDAALAAHRQAVQLAPASPTVHFNYGVALAQDNGAAGEAKAEYERAVALEPNYAEAHNALGLLLAGTAGHWEEAIAHFRAAVKAQPDADSLHFNLAAALERGRGTANEAAMHYREAIRLNPRNTSARINYGWWLLKQPAGQSDALIQFTAALRIEPENAAAHYALGVALLAMRGREAEGTTHLEIASRLAPGWAEPHLALDRLRARRE